MPEPKVGNIKFAPNPASGSPIDIPKSTRPVESYPIPEYKVPDFKLPILGLMSAIVCMGILFGTRRTLSTAFAGECAQFAVELYNQCERMSS